MSWYDCYGDERSWEMEPEDDDARGECPDCAGPLLPKVDRAYGLPYAPLQLLECQRCEELYDVCHWCEGPLDIYEAVEVEGDYMHPRCAKECAEEEARCEREAVTGVRGAA